MSPAGVAALYTDRLFWALQIVGWGAYSLERALSPGHFFPHGFSHVAINFFLTSLLHPLYYRLQERRPRLWLLALAALAGSVAATVAMPLLDDLIPFMVPPGPRRVVRLSDISVVHLLARGGVVTFLLWSAAYVAIRQWDLSRGDRERALKAETLARRAELKLLHAQLNPHFLFNALNGIQALLKEDPQRAERTLRQFSGFLAYSLEQAGNERVKLEEEFRAIEAYLAIQKTRFEDGLDAETALSSEAAGRLVPPLLVYPLVENAVKYGRQSGCLPVRVRLTAACRGQTLVVDVANTGRWQEPAPRGTVGAGLGLGLANVRTRLAELYPARHRLAVREEGGWVKVTIEIEHA